MVKAFLERCRNRVVEYILKLLFFNAAFTVIFLTMKAAVLNSLPNQFRAVWLLYAVANAVFIVYDLGFSKLIGFYISRIGRATR